MSNGVNNFTLDIMRVELQNEGKSTEILEIYLQCEKLVCVTGISQNHTENYCYIKIVKMESAVL